MSIQVEPLQDRVLVKPAQADKITKGGIHLPENTAEDRKQTQGTVVAVGPGLRADNGEKIEIGVEVGDTVVYSKYAGVDIKVDGEDHVVLREKDLLVKLRENDGG